MTNIAPEELAQFVEGLNADKAIAYLEDQKPGFIETVAYNELKHAIKKYPANLAMKKLCLKMMQDIETIENKEDRNAAKRVFVRAAFDVSENGIDSQGAKYFLDNRNVEFLF